MKSPLSVLPVTVLVAPLCALAGIVVRASERARRAKDSRRLGAGLSGGGGGTARGTVSWWTKKPLSPDAEEMEQGRRGRVEEFYDGIEKGRRNEELEAFQHEGKQDVHDVPPLGVCPSFDNGVWRKRLE